MKKLLTAVAAFSLLLCAFSCNKQQPQEEEDPVASLEVKDIDNNCATIKVTLTKGNPYGGKIIKMIAQDEVTVDPTNEIQLINFIEKNGEAITVPYEVTLKELKAGKKVFTAVLVYNKEGRASSSAYQKWETVGDPDGWSTDNSAGNLNEINW